MRDRREAERFVARVHAALTRIDDEKAQDRLDLELLGVELPPTPDPTPDPLCRDCEGTGSVCICHGLPPFELGHAPFETCPCVKPRPVHSAALADAPNGPIGPKSLPTDGRARTVGVSDRTGQSDPDLP